jgi:hypothetical protein
VPAVAALALLLMTATIAIAADTDGPVLSAGMNRNWVTVAPVARVLVRPGVPAKVEINFRVAPGFHINSSQPKSDLLVPTALKFDPPTDLAVGKLAFPPGHELAFDFAPEEKLDVYSGDFRVTALVTAAKSIPAGTYRVRGTLKYQACSDRACFPPRQLPLEFDVRVENRRATRHTRNPGQSPHVHR